MREIKEGDIVEIINPGENYNWFPDSMLINDHAKKLKKGDTMKIVDIAPANKYDGAVLFYLGNVNDEWVSLNKKAFKVLTPTEILYSLY